VGLEVLAKLFSLLGPDPGIDQDVAVVGLNEKAPHRPGAHILFVRGIFSFPELFGDDPKHSASV